MVYKNKQSEQPQILRTEKTPNLSKINILPQVILLCGLQGSGKSTIGRLLHSRVNSDLFLSDLIRKEFFGQSDYSPEQGDFVYREMIARAKLSLSRGFPVILDATYGSSTRRANVFEVFQRLGMKIKVIYVVVKNDDVIRDRLNNRTDDPSDATYDIYLKSKSNFEIPQDAILVQNDGSEEELGMKIGKLIKSEFLLET